MSVSTVSLAGSGSWPLGVLGYVIAGLVSLIGLRYVSYYRSFFAAWARYRQAFVSIDELAALALPFVKVQVTTRGRPSSTPAIRRGISQVLQFVEEAQSCWGPC